MPARTGEQYIARLKDHQPTVYMGGEKVMDVTTHLALRNGIHTLARLYDLQHDSELRDEMTYVSPTTGERVGLSFITPRSMEYLEKQNRMMTRWARLSCGMMGRSPDFMNVNIMAMAAAGDYFAQNRPECKNNIQNYYEYIRENDRGSRTLCLTSNAAGPLVPHPYKTGLKRLTTSWSCARVAATYI